MPSQGRDSRTLGLLQIFDQFQEGNRLVGDKFPIEN
jgi:hypothetical protein